jgi:hypothetical protein
MIEIRIKQWLESDKQPQSLLALMSLIDRWLTETEERVQ